MPSTSSKTGFAACGAVLLAMLVLIGEPLLAEDDDWRRLNEDVQMGKVKSLGEVLDNLARDYIGEVIDVELEVEDGQTIYEIELLGPQGQVVEFEVNAVTGELIGIEGRNIDEMKRQ